MSAKDIFTWSNTKFQRAKITRNVWHTIKRTDDKITSIEK